MISPMPCPQCGQPVKPEHGDYSVSVYCQSCLDVDCVGGEFQSIGLQATVGIHEAPSWEACEVKATEGWNEAVLDYICERWYAALEERKP